MNENTSRKFSSPVSTIQNAIQAFSLESDIDFYPIFIFDENDVGKNCWASTFSYSDNSIQTESLDALINAQRHL